MDHATPNMASDSVRSGPTNYEDSTPEWTSDTFAYRSPNKNPFLRFAYPRVKKDAIDPGCMSMSLLGNSVDEDVHQQYHLVCHATDSSSILFLVSISWLLLIFKECCTIAQSPTIISKSQ